MGTLSGVMSIVGDQTSSYCALLLSAEVDCWGQNMEGELGNNSEELYSDFPVNVVSTDGHGSLSGVTSLVSSDAGNCARLDLKEVACWGADEAGNLGDGTITADSAIPNLVDGVGGVGTLSDVTFVAGDWENHCAALASGDVDCWGDNAASELGAITNTDISDVPVTVSFPS